MPENVIHVAYALDDNYTEFTCVSMTSLLHNTTRPVHFHVLENRLAEANKQILRDIGKRYSHGNWAVYHVENDERFIVDNKARFTVETYFRLYLPEVLNGLDKVLWMDSDTVINGDIGELFDTNVDGVFAGVVADNVIDNDKKRCRAVGIRRADTYFNAGVMLLNLGEVRKINLLEEAKSITQIFFEKLRGLSLKYYVDQDVINYIFARKVKLLPWKYNFMFDFEIGGLNEAFTLREFADALSNPLVIHYNGFFLRDIATLNSRKFIYNAFWKLYYKYKKLTCFANVNDDIKITKYELNVAYSQKLFITQEFISRYTTTQEFIRHNRYITFANAPNFIAKQIGGRKVAIWGYNSYTCLLMALLLHGGIKVDCVVDGLAVNQLERVYDLVTQAPDLLYGRNKEYFVIIDVVNRATAVKINAALSDYGYGNDDSYFIYNALYEADGEDSYE